MASQLTREQVDRIAELARLELSPEDAVLFARQLTAILDYAATVGRVDTSGVAPADTTRDGTAWREDEPGACIDRAEALSEAPDSSRDHGLFRVPKVI